MVDLTTPAIQSPQSFTSQVASNPVNNVGSYVNQQLGSLSTGLGSSTGGTPTSTSIATQTASPQSSLQAQTQGMYGTMNDDNARQLSQLQTLTSIRQRQQQQQQPQQVTTTTTSQQTASAGGGSSTPSAGNAYQPNGALSPSRNQALQTASSYLGDPYVLGGTSHGGIDCSGLVMMVYDQFGFGPYLNSHLAGHQAQAIPGVRTNVANLRPGDLVCWNDGSHIAIYAGNGQIIEAANERVGTVKRALWSNAVFGIRLRLPGE